MQVWRMMLAAGLALGAPVQLACAQTATSLVYVNEARLQTVKAAGARHGSPFAKAIAALRKEADAALGRPVDPVTNKTQTPPSGDKHDYFSLSPYRWPDPSKADGLPWVYRDGEVNPLTRGPATDQVRSSIMLRDLETLSLAYYVTGERRYGQRLTAILDVWFLDPATRMNPNVNHGQVGPGADTGHQSGLIEWSAIGAVVTATQLAARDRLWPDAKQAAMDKWLGDFLDWMRTSQIGRNADNAKNNHGSWSDYKQLGLMIYLGRDDAARALAQAMKRRRIADKIDTNGVQTEEVNRTKSVNYSTMNLWALTVTSELADKLGVDLRGYSAEDGRGMALAFHFLAPYANGQSGWRYRQITAGGVEASVDKALRPMIAKAEVVWGRQWLDDTMRARARARLSPQDRVAYAIPD